MENTANYILTTDDCSDLPPAYYEEHHVPMQHLSFLIDDKSYTTLEMPLAEFYRNLHSGKMPSTSQVTTSQWKVFFEPFLKAGKDILFFGFSSGLSGSYGAAQVAAKELGEAYPDRKIITVDSLCASLGQGFLLDKMVKLRDSGMGLEELAAWAEKNKLRVSHMVAVDDLMHLHRGGRVSKTSAVAGSLLGIKPIIHMNNEGKLIAIDKVRGRKQSLVAVVDKTEKLVGDTENDSFMICHSDCEEEANQVAEMVSKRFGIKDYLVHFIGPVIASHTGPGTIALFMMAKNR